MTDSAREEWDVALREFAAGSLDGRAYWRGIHELLRDPEFRAAALREFPVAPGGARSRDRSPGVGGGETLSRREFLTLMGASLALAGIGGCLEAPRERIYPYTERPSDVIPGVARSYATAMPLDGYATGLLVESHEGRPTKIEGNPLHPASLGAAGVYEQASILQLYDPFRARAPRREGATASWLRFQREVVPPSRTPGRTEDGGAGLRILARPTASPLTTLLIRRFLEVNPLARLTSYAPLASEAPIEGTRFLFGRPAQPVHELSGANVILALDADFLSASPFHLAYARDWADRRVPTLAGDSMNRLYAVETTVSPTGTAADRRLRARPTEIPMIASAVLESLVRRSEPIPDGLPDPRSAVSAGTLAASFDFGGDGMASWLSDLTRDLIANQGRSVVIAGDRQPPEVHAIAATINVFLGNVGRTVRYLDPVMPDFGPAAQSLESLTAEMHAGEVDTLVILDGNPVYDAPADLAFGTALNRVERAIFHGLHENETAAACRWSLPGLHYLESWGDVRALDGTASIVQPLIRPLYDGRSVDDLLMILNGVADRPVHDELRDLWAEWSGVADFDGFWRTSLRRGVIPETESPVIDVAPDWRALRAPLAERIRTPSSDPGEAVRIPGTTPADGTIEVVFARDASVYDGRFANNPWLQELPDPLTKLTWDNAAIVSPRTGIEMGLASGSVARVRLAESEVVIPVFVLPGHADGCVTLPLGYGRGGAESVAHGVGTDVYPLRTSAAPYAATGATIEPVGGPFPLATTQEHWSMEGRPIVLSATLAEYREDPEFAEPHRRPTPSLYPSFDYESGDQWTMMIDLAACTGCGACVVACQAENNVPVVGKEGVLDSREMHWLRIDRYFSGPADQPTAVFQPMLCQHCERAPCEYVCPVNATTHSADGLNEMVYNRCIGTRFCSNNCPYKVRRFNWMDYQTGTFATLEMQKNPDVTVRARGVMEKCTFCVQRIRRAQIDARLEDRELNPGEVRTACQQTCPTRAISFGSYNQPDDLLRRRLADPRRYVVLNELGTRPRVNYLARIDNPGGGADV